MGSFKHHSYFVKERYVQRFLFPRVCLACCKVYRKPLSGVVRLCPQCVGPLTALSRKFSAPKSKDIKQWEKVRFLVENGFLFQTVQDRNESVRYPKTLVDAKEFVAKYRWQAVLRANLKR